MKASTSEMEDLRARLESSERENLQLKGILKERDAELVAATQRVSSSDNKAAQLEAMRMELLDELRRTKDEARDALCTADMKLLSLEAEKASLSSGLLEARAELEESSAVCRVVKGELSEQRAQARQLKKKYRDYKWKAQFYLKELSDMAISYETAYCL